jgi:hypothetical protein
MKRYGDTESKKENPSDGTSKSMKSDAEAQSETK